MTDYITRAQLKAHLSIPVLDTDDDTIIDRIVASTSRAVENWCHRRTFGQDAAASTRTFHADTYGRVYVDDIATATGLAVATDDDDDGVFEQSWTVATDFVVEPSNALADGQPATRLVAVGDLWFPAGNARASVSVTATFGWPAVPDEVVEATLIKAARLFGRKDTPNGVAGTGEFGVVRITNREDPDVVALLAPFRRLVGVA
jgi:hypothetical protein